jgi:hypothetical protein
MKQDTRILHNEMSEAEFSLGAVIIGTMRQEDTIPVLIEEALRLHGIEADTDIEHEAKCLALGILRGSIPQSNIPSIGCPCAFDKFSLDPSQYMWPVYGTADHRCDTKCQDNVVRKLERDASVYLNLLDIIDNGICHTCYDNGTDCVCDNLLPIQHKREYVVEYKVQGWYYEVEKYLSEIFSELIDVINEASNLPHVYFGTYEDDPASIGWQADVDFSACDMKSVTRGHHQAGPIVSYDRDCGLLVEVNDHGNFTAKLDASHDRIGGYTETWSTLEGNILFSVV